MKQVKVLFPVILSLFILVLASCAPSGTQPAQGWSGTVFYDGMLYVGSLSGKVVAVNPLTQNIEWSYALATQSSGGMSCSQASVSSAIYAMPAVDGDLVYVGSYSNYGGKVLALSASARSQGLPFPQVRNGEWSYPRTNDEIIGSIVGNPVVSGNAIYAASSNGRVYSLDKRFGDLNWESDVLCEKLWTTPVIEGDTVYLSTFDGHFYALSTETGKKLPWTFESEVGFISSPVLYDDTMFVGSFDNNLYAIKVGSDKPLWKFPGGRWFWAAPVAKDGVIYAGCLDGKVYAINAETGKGLWEFDTKSLDPRVKGSPIVSPPILVSDSLVVADESGNVYVINLKTGSGERIKNPEDDNKPTIGALVRAPLCAYEGTVYIHAQDDYLYSVDVGQKKVSKLLSLSTKQES